MDQKTVGKMTKKLDDLGRRNVYIMNEISSMIGTLQFRSVLVEKNCNFTNSSWMFIFLFVNEIYDTFTFLERIRRWDFKYFEFSCIDFSPFTWEIFEYVNGIFSEFSFSWDICLRFIDDGYGIIPMGIKDEVIVCRINWKWFYRSYYWGKKLLKIKGGKKLGIGETPYVTWNKHTGQH